MYQALYRKWRPQTFSDVIGQKHITSTLKNQVDQGKTAHAYLFTGTRGTGKTTCAKIFAKAANCESPIDGDPCNKCESCVGINSGNVLDVIEIDAASNNGVDNIRDIREEAVYTPAQLKKRVYIIDEVHMLSSGAFNALLKTLEEPPEHVMFILATTEVQKLPATIISRCQRYDFKRIDALDIAERLLYICKCEGIEITEDAAKLIGRLADGAMRDALSILDQCRGAGVVSVDVVSRAAGLVGSEYLSDIASAVRKSDAASALSVLDRLYEDGKDVGLLCSELISHYRDMLIAKTVNDFERILKCGKAEGEAIRQEASVYTVESIIYCIGTLEEALNRISRTSLSKRVEMEICLLRLCNPRLSALPESVLARVAELEAKLASIQLGAGEIAAASCKAPQKSTRRAESQTLPRKATTEKAKATDKKPAPFWADVKSAAKSGGNIAFAVHLDQVEAQLAGDKLIIAAKDSFTEDLLKKADNFDLLKKYVAAASGADYEIVIESVSNGDKPGSSAGLDDIIRQSSEFPDIIEIID